MTNKYNAKKCRFGDEVYDSKKEMRRHQELLLLERDGQISGLKRQVEYLLIPAQRETTIINGIPMKGKVIERKVSYTADFVYFDRRKQEVVVEDAKGVKTRDYVMRRKLMLYIHGIRITEV